MAKSTSERRGLGRGLSALMADLNAPIDGPEEGVSRTRANPDIFVPIEKVHPNPDQPRSDFQKADMEELAASVKEKGIIQPLLVRKSPDQAGDYQIIAGERRWRAAQMAKLHELPVLIREFSDSEVIEVAIIENIQRADLNPVEEALGFRQLIARFGHTQERLAEVIGKSRSHIANLMRLLTLPDEVLAFLRDGKLTVGHARTLVTADNPLALAKEIMQKGLSVRQAEGLAKATSPKRKKTRNIKTIKDADTVALEYNLTANLGMKVGIDHNQNAESGVVTIRYQSLDQLDELCGVLTSMPQAETK